MDTSHAPESFRGMLLRDRGRTGLIQRDFAARAGVSRRSVQDWESGVNYPTAERLQAVIGVLLESGGLTAGRETAEARELWAAVEHEASRMHTPFDEEWFARLVAAHPAPAPGPAANTLHAAPAAEPGSAGVERAEDWGEAPDTMGFVGRADELALMRRWVLDEHCRLVAILGMGGIGKTSLAARLVLEVAPSFERVYWRSLRDAPPPIEWLAGAIGFLSDQQLVPPAAESERLAALLQLLRERRCLLVLDNSETLFEPGQREGRYRTGMAGYGRLLQAVGEGRHQSCLVLTSREAPPEQAVLGGDAIRRFQLGGLGVDEAQVLLAHKQLEGTGQQWAEFNARFAGNGLALKVVAETIRELFGGRLGNFLEEASDGSIFGSIRRLLTEQVERSSAVEQQVLRGLAVEREPVRLAALLAALGPSVGRAVVLEAVEALRRRSLVERAVTVGPAVFTLQSVVLEYVTDRLVEIVADEIASGQPVLLVEQPLMRAQAKDYVRQTQERLIGAPILQQLNVRHGAHGTERRLLALLENWRDRPAAEQDYGPGNVVNLLRLLRGELRGLDLSRLAIRQAYLQGTEAQDASLAGATLPETVLGDAFGAVVAVALSADGMVVAAGTLGGEVQAWRIADRAPVLAARGHVGAVWSVALSADGRLLVSGGNDGAVWLWDVAAGQPLGQLAGNLGGVWGVAMDADGRLVASGGYDRTVRVWETKARRLLATLEGHADAVRWVSLSADGRLLASGGNDGTVRLWEGGQPADLFRPLDVLESRAGVIFGVAMSADGRLVASAQSDGVRLWRVQPGARGTSQADRLLAILQGHAGMVYGVGMSADARLVASGGTDGTVRLWEAEGGRPLAILEGHTSAVHGVALSADGRLVASGSDDGSVRLWESDGGRPLGALDGRAGAVFGVALSADGQLLASGSDDGSVRLWQAQSGQQLAEFEGRGGVLSGVALSADGHFAASGGNDGLVRVWEDGQALLALGGHAGVVYGVSLSADGRLVASGGNDGTVRLWEVWPEEHHGQPLAILEGHSGGAYGIALSGDGRRLASGGDDGTVRLWSLETPRMGGEMVLPLGSLEGNAGVVYAVALSADGRFVASGGLDGTVRLWDVERGLPLATLQGQTGAVWGVALSADGRLLASGGDDAVVRVWEVSGRSPVVALSGHGGVIRAVAFSADGRFLASGSLDGTVRLWDTAHHTLLRTLRPDRRFERMDITELNGVTYAQRVSLLALGAREQV
jgi:WD40 repeat protein/transcriptional regulator with XRE-family HTH domain